jgi:Tfp pilus assembly protein PilX
MNLMRRLTDERGVALPMAMMTLLLLTTLMLAFAVLSQTEPVIAANQLRVAQARALAESGFERALWALRNPADANGLPSPLPLANPGVAASTAVAPYDGATFFSGDSVTTGGFMVSVRNDQSAAADVNVREVTAVGWTPTNVNTDTRPKAHRTLFARVSVIPDVAFQAPCALCVKGALNITGNSAINGSNEPPPGQTANACGGNNKHGTFTRDSTVKSGSSAVVGGFAADGTRLSVAQNQPESAFDGFSLTASNMLSLKDLAKKNGTYFGPGYPNGGTTPDYSTPYSCNVVFNSTNKVGNGMVFVDSCDGQALTPSSSTTNIASVTIHGNPFTGQPPLPDYPTTPASAFSGWLVVNGSLRISGNMAINGLVYAVNDFTYNGTGTGAINGLAISQNMFDASATSIDTSAAGNSAINFSCDNVRQLPNLPVGFQFVQGSYRELTD